jgi:hypothetical protein
MGLTAAEAAAAPVILRTDASEEIVKVFFMDCSIIEVCRKLVLRSGSRTLETAPHSGGPDDFLFWSQAG